VAVVDRIHIGWSSYVPGDTIASDRTAETQYPIANMQNSSPNSPTVFDLTGQTVMVLTNSNTVSEDRTATCVAVHNHNLPIDTTIKLELFSLTGQGGSTVYDSGAVNVHKSIPFGSVIAGVDGFGSYFIEGSQLKTHFSILFTDVVFRSWRITITNSAGFTNNTISIDKLWLSFAWNPDINPSYGMRSTLLDASEHQKKPGGGVETISREVVRSIQMQFKQMENAQRHTIRHILERAKMGGDLFISADPNNAISLNFEMTSIFRRTNSMTFAHTFFDNNEFGLSVEEN